MTEHVRSLNDLEYPIDDTAAIKAEHDQLGVAPGDAMALCLSGGGIRSATFGLGVLQGLAAKGILQHMDYLSTVSGGGYIGSWLSALLHRHGEPAAAMQELTPSHQPEPPELLHLRRFSNYLTPKLGLFSSDTWTLVSVVMRNLLLNWLVLLPVLAAGLLIPRLALALMLAAPQSLTLGMPVAAGAVLFAVVCILFALFSLKRRGSPQQLLFYLALGSLVAAAVLASFELWNAGRLLYWRARLSWSDWAPEAVGIGVATLFVLYVLAWHQLGRHGGRIVRLANALLLGLALIAAELWLLLHQVLPSLGQSASLFACFAGPALIVALLFCGYLMTGLLHIDLRDEQREWLSSLSGWLLKLSLLWVVACALVFFGTELLYPDIYRGIAWASSLATYGTGIGAVASAIATVLGGYGTSSSSGHGKPAVLSLTAKVGLPALLLFVTLILSRMADAMLNGFWAVHGNAHHHQELLIHTNPGILLALLSGLALASIIFSRFISINKFSLHAAYRNRLIRAYLGASRKREANPITGFDVNDNLPIHELSGHRPLQVVNMTLNLAGGKELAWQERRAESFTCNCLFSGAWPPGRGNGLGYRSSRQYGGLTDGPISLGTAMAISGAAANPNMGYCSSPLLTFVMTLLNARLGWWLGNPGIAGGTQASPYPSWNRSGPALGLVYLLKEAFGRTTDTTRYVNLSDGGHFENLGMYEMVRRKCRFIIVADAGCDPLLTLSDLGNAIRKCRIDFGVSIEFDDSLNKVVARQQRMACATIRYPNQDHTGRLVYLKPLVFQSETRDEPPDVRSYHDEHRDFPHETTADQFFSESQFESYRQLGLHTVRFLPKLGAAARVTAMNKLAGEAIQLKASELP